MEPTIKKDGMNTEELKLRREIARLKETNGVLQRACEIAEPILRSQGFHAAHERILNALAKAKREHHEG